MKIVSPLDTSHIIRFIPRYTPISDVEIKIYDEGIQTVNDVVGTYTMSEGILTYTFDYTFEEGNRYQISLSESEEVLYVGKVLCDHNDIVSDDIIVEGTGIDQVGAYIIGDYI